MTVALITPSGLITETVTISAGAATLDFIPNVDAIKIEGFSQIFEGSPGVGEFKATVDSAELEFNTANNGDTPDVNYYGASAPGVTVEKVNELIVDINNGGFTFPNPMTAEGDTIVGGVDGEPEALAVGSEGEVLKVVSGVPAWSADAGFANPMTTEGDIIIGGTAGAPEALAAGGETQVLTMGTVKPEWRPLPTSGRPIVELFTWDFDVDGGATGVHNLGSLPAGSVVQSTNAICNTPVTSAGGGEFVFLGNVTSAQKYIEGGTITAASFNVAGIVKSKPIATSSTENLVANDLPVNFTIDAGGEALTGGKITFAITYIIIPV